MDIYYSIYDKRKEYAEYREIKENNEKMRKQNGKWKKIAVVGVFLIIVTLYFIQEARDTSLAAVFFQNLKNDIYVKAMETHMPLADVTLEKLEDQPTVWSVVCKKMTALIPIQGYMDEKKQYDTTIESPLNYEKIQSKEERKKIENTGDILEEKQEKQDISSEPFQKSPQIKLEDKKEDMLENFQEKNVEAIEKVVTIPREKLEDFDYLIQNFYTIDKTTTIDRNQLKVKEFLEKDMSLQIGSEKPQILILHTHSQERYADSNENIETSIVGVGEYLAKLLKENYGFHVIHSKESYDQNAHDDAYAHAGVGIEEILAENPSIEVIIDMHRDGIKEGKLVTEINGKPTAKIMFFNGISKTTANGNLSYLPNPNLADNLAFSLQLKIAAEEYYPGLTRANYIKGYRYNLHYRPKSLLVEIGAQTNTVQEAMNAMEPLADLLNKVLSQ